MLGAFFIENNFDTEETDMNYSTITKFWFEEIHSQKWFEKDEDFDSILTKKFSNQVQLALADKLDYWKIDLEGCLSLILLLDQFTRNIYRDNAKAFSGDLKALDLCLHAIKNGYLLSDNSSWRHFMLMPMMHSENLAIQEMSLPLFKKYTNERTFEFAKKHHDIVSKFNRYPHRNQILGRQSSEEEMIFLSEPGSSF